MPDTIWANEPDIFDDMGLWQTENDLRGVEYIRRDLYDEVFQEYVDSNELRIDLVKELEEIRLKHDKIP